MKRFLQKCLLFLLIGLTPFLLILPAYIYSDPFKVIRRYDDYYTADAPINRDHQSTQNFINNYSRYHYNSFLFGSSRVCLGIKPSAWRKYLSSDAVPYSFDASLESLYGIAKKIEWLDASDVRIANAVVLLCRDCSFATAENSTGHVLIKSPVTSGESPLYFQYTFFKAFTNPKSLFLFRYYCYQFTRQYRSFMAGYIADPGLVQPAYDPSSNELVVFGPQNEIEKDSLGYYAKMSRVFYKRPEEERVDSVHRINAVHISMLKEIKRIFDKQHTNYKIVLTPLYEEIKYNPADLTILRSIFGDRIYDLSGKNSLTESKTNYYENAHFRPRTGEVFCAGSMELPNIEHRILHTRRLRFPCSVSGVSFLQFVHFVCGKLHQGFDICGRKVEFESSCFV